MSLKTPKSTLVSDFPMVCVTWVDARLDPSDEGNPSEQPISTFGALAECQDIGFLVRSTRKEVVLAVSRCAFDNTIRHSNTIPRGWIKHIVHLTPIVVEST